jgi:hypothetical protein
MANLDAFQVLKRLNVTSTLTWTKYTKTYANFSAAATTNDIELFSLPAGGVIHAVKIKHSTAFAGTSITAYTISVGITGTLAKYATAYNVFQAVAPATFQIGAVPSIGIGSENHTTAVSIRAAATSTGANLSAATAGVVEIWVLTSTCSS